MKDLIKIGKIQPKRAVDIKTSKIGIGFEKLDRGLFEPEKAYPFLAELGVKKIRIQSGWQRTEREKGVYDFSWLDSIVDKMISMKIEPWMCLCYGNELYTEEAKKHFGAVGCPPIRTETERRAWYDYVKATVTHFKGRVRLYEVWNEPDGQWCWKHGPNADELSDFTVDTVKACKEADPDCMVAGLVLAFSEDFAQKFSKTDAMNYIDAITYHSYDGDERMWTEKYNVIKDILTATGHQDIKIIQGEGGTQSKRDGCGALAGGAWSEEIQSKYLLRHLITDIALGNEFTSYFSCMDMAEALNGTVGDTKSISDFGYFGVIGAEFDENAVATGEYYAKQSYYALQTLCSVLSEEYELIKPEIENVSVYSGRMLNNTADFNLTKHFAFKRADGSLALFYWKPADILTETYNGKTSFKLKTDGIKGNVSIVNMLDGSIYSSEGLYEENDGEYFFKKIPLTDSPLLITIGNFIK